MIWTQTSTISVNVLLAMVAISLVRKVTEVYVSGVFSYFWQYTETYEKGSLIWKSKGTHRLFCSSIPIQISAKENVNLYWFICDALGGS